MSEQMDHSVSYEMISRLVSVAHWRDDRTGLVKEEHFPR